jgi:hypothetical protein
MVTQKIGMPFQFRKKCRVSPAKIMLDELMKQQKLGFTIWL